jgi:hypothetical protein
MRTTRCDELALHNYAVGDFLNSDCEGICFGRGHRGTIVESFRLYLVVTSTSISIVVLFSLCEFIPSTSAIQATARCVWWQQAMTMNFLICTANSVYNPLIRECIEVRHCVGPGRCPAAYFGIKRPSPTSPARFQDIRANLVNIAFHSSLETRVFEPFVQIKANVGNVFTKTSSLQRVFKLTNQGHNPPPSGICMQFTFSREAIFQM